MPCHDKKQLISMATGQRNVKMHVMHYNVDDLTQFSRQSMTCSMSAILNAEPNIKN